MTVPELVVQNTFCFIRQGRPPDARACLVFETMPVISLTTTAQGSVNTDSDLTLR